MVLVQLIEEALIKSELCANESEIPSDLRAIHRSVEKDFNQAKVDELSQ